MQSFLQSESIHYLPVQKNDEQQKNRMFISQRGGVRTDKKIAFLSGRTGKADKIEKAL